MRPPSLERVLQALDAVNNRTETYKDRNVLQAVGGTSFRGGRFELALSLDEVAEKIGEPPGTVTHRVNADTTFAQPDFSGKSTSGTRTSKLEGKIGILHIGPRGKLKHRRAR